MYKPAKIIVGIVIFLVIITFPIWSNFGGNQTSPDMELSLDTPTINAMEDPHCIYDAEYMRENHMKVLNDWKVEVVRHGNYMTIGDDGKEYLASLQNTCFDCHSNYEEFCLVCHEYSNVDPACWSCHVEPTQENLAREVE